MGKVANIRPCAAPPTMEPVKSWMFCAHDRQEHTLCWSEYGKAWMIENPRHGFIKWYPNLISGLSGLERVSGNKANDFTTIDNPYGD